MVDDILCAIPFRHCRKNCPGRRSVVPSVSSEDLQQISFLTMELIPSKTRPRFSYQAEGLSLQLRAVSTVR